MIAHLVLFRPKPDLSKEDRRALVNAFERAVRDIPSVRAVRVGRRVIHGAGYEQSMPDTGEYLIVIDFDDVEGLQTYLRHPVHEELGVRFYQSLSSTLIYDFEAGGVEGLENLMRT
jgi:stress responsive alpha/beta barrel protein